MSNTTEEVTYLTRIVRSETFEAAIPATGPMEAIERLRYRILRYELAGVQRTGPVISECTAVVVALSTDDGDAV